MSELYREEKDEGKLRGSLLSDAPSGATGEFNFLAVVREVIKIFIGEYGVLRTQVKVCT